MQSDWLLKLRIVFAIHFQGEAVVTLSKISAVYQKRRKNALELAIDLFVCYVLKQSFTSVLVNISTTIQIYHSDNNYYKEGR